MKKSPDKKAYRRTDSARQIEIVCEKADTYILSPEAEAWASKKRQGCSKTKLREMLIAQRGRCALSGAPLIFDKDLGTPKAGGEGCHPLYPAVDHIVPGSKSGGWQLVSYDLNDLKGHLPDDCFRALVETDAWKRLMAEWKAQAEKDPLDREAFRHLRKRRSTE
jgi:hypothetical protein